MPLEIDADRLPRLLYIGDVAVADTGAGEALLFRLLQFYPPDKLAVICGVRPDMPTLPGVAYHHWGAAFPRVLTSRVAEEYCIWHAWRYYRVPGTILGVVATFRPDAILSISHVSAWLAAWQLAERLAMPFHLIAHDDFVYQNRFPPWARPWAARKFGEAYRAASSRLCISDTMAETYERRFGAPSSVIYPTAAPAAGPSYVCSQVNRRVASLTFAYGGSINTAAQMQQIIAFASIAGVRGHRLVAYTPQHDALRSAGGAVAWLDVRAPVHSADLRSRLRQEADCLFLPQSMAEAERQSVASAFPTKWADYSTMGLPLLVWAPPWSSSARFVARRPGCAHLVDSADAAGVAGALAQLEASSEYRWKLAQTLLAEARQAFSPEAGWRTLSAALTIQ